MKKYLKKIGLACLAGVILLSSCDPMDTKPLDILNEDDVWTSKLGVDAFIVGSYPGTLGQIAGSNRSRLWEERTPHGVKLQQGGTDGWVSELQLSPTSNTVAFGYFGEQRRCNMILERVPDLDFLSADQKKEMIAEAHFLRAILWFDLTRKSGRFVPITKVLETDSQEEFKTPLTESVAKSYELIMAELEIACRDMAETSATGRANRYAALALRSRAALQAYAYTGNAAYLDVVINSAQEVIDSGNYELTSNYGSMFNDNAPYDSEIILGRYHLAKTTYVFDIDEQLRTMPNVKTDEVIRGSKDGINTLDDKQVIFEGWGESYPSQDLVDQYLVIDDVTGEAKNWWETSQYLNNIDPIAPSSVTAAGDIEVFTRFDGQIRQIPSEDDFVSDRTDSDTPLFRQMGRLKPGATKNVTEIIYGNRDKRMDAVVVRDYTEWYGFTVELNTGGNISTSIPPNNPNGSAHNTVTGYYWRKGNIRTYPRGAVNTQLNYHYVAFRLGEMYLNQAEAYLLKRDYAKAVIALNMTREKHGGLPASTASNLTDAWADYIRERRADMPFECGDIYFSYLRWGKYGGDSNFGRTPGDVIFDLSRPIYKMSISNERDAFCVGQVTLGQAWNRNFTVRRYLFPIPQNDMNKRLAGGIREDNNPGW